MNAFWLFTVLMLFVGPVVGVACATVAFTAYNIVCPIMLVGFNATVYDSVFTSLAMDFSCSIVTLLVYSRSKYSPFRRFQHPILLASTPFCIAGGIGGFFMARSLLPSVKFLLKGSLPVLSFLIGASFFFKSFRQWRAYLRRGGVDGDPDGGAVADGDEDGDGDADADGDGERDGGDSGSGSDPESGISGTVTDTDTGYVDAASVEDRGGSGNIQIDVKELEHKHDLQLELEGGARFPSVGRSWALLCLGALVVTFLGSFTGFGGGFLFFAIACAAFDFRMVTGVAYGCYGMAWLSGITCSMYLAFGLVDLGAIYQQLLVAILLGCVGAIFGANYAMRATRVHVLSLVIAVTLTLGGVLTLLLPLITPAIPD